MVKRIATCKNIPIEIEIEINLLTKSRPQYRRAYANNNYDWYTTTIHQPKQYFFNKLLWSHFWIDFNKFYTKTFRIVYILTVYLLCLYEWFLFVHNLNITNQRLPGACNRSPGSMLLPITTQLHCGSHLGGRARLPDTILEEDHQMTIPSKFGSNWATGSRQDGFYVNFP